MKRRGLLPKGFTKGLGNFTKEFLGGVWHGIGPDIRRKGWLSRQ